MDIMDIMEIDLGKSISYHYLDAGSPAGDSAGIKTE
jgi:hypothetical protein